MKHTLAALLASDSSPSSSPPPLPSSSPPSSSSPSSSPSSSSPSTTTAKATTSSSSSLCVPICLLTAATGGAAAAAEIATVQRAPPLAFGEGRLDEDDDEDIDDIDDDEDINDDEAKSNHQGNNIVEEEDKDMIIQRSHDDAIHGEAEGGGAVVVDNVVVDAEEEEDEEEDERSKRRKSQSSESLDDIPAAAATATLVVPPTSSNNDNKDSHTATPAATVSKVSHAEKGKEEKVAAAAEAAAADDDKPAANGAILPRELLEAIFRWVDVSDLGRIAQVCRVWSELLQSSGSVWRSFFDREPTPRLLAVCNGSYREATIRQTELKNLSRGSIVFTEKGDAILMARDGKKHTLSPRPGGRAEKWKYEHITFSPCGLRVAFTYIESRMSKYVTHTCFIDGSDLTSVTTELPAFYYFFSPDGKRLGWLSNRAGQQVTFQLVDVENKPDQSVEIDFARPLFFAWSPDSNQLVAHCASQLKFVDLLCKANNFTVNGPARFDVAYFTTRFAAPIWYPSSKDVILYFESGLDSTVNLMAYSLSSRCNICKIMTCSGQFYQMVCAKNGMRLAVSSFLGNRTIIIDLPDLLDADAYSTWQTIRWSEQEVSSNDARLVDLKFTAKAFFWSPNSLYLFTLGEQNDNFFAHITDFSSPGAARQSALETEGGLSTIYHFFDQYAQSSCYWTPDSSKFMLSYDGVIEIYEYNPNDNPHIRQSWRTSGDMSSFSPL